MHIEVYVHLNGCNVNIYAIVTLMIPHTRLQMQNIQTIFFKIMINIVWIKKIIFEKKYVIYQRWYFKIKIVFKKESDWCHKLLLEIWKYISYYILMVWFKIHIKNRHVPERGIRHVETCQPVISRSLQFSFDVLRNAET